MRSIDVRTLAASLAAGSVTVVDVREAWELDVCRIEPSTHLPLSEFAERFAEVLPEDGQYALLCHHGMRSAQATRFLASKGYSDVSNVEGGIDAWALEVDTGMARY